ncbi:hypothetical protein [Paraflavitalea sp. CAU 1676]|uniref:hypothetical protein n=1 Tax=Paraflavitalea sp. CAU 1676 TaxID=3032598 RepID=UPI0023DA392F|nr:hypothetical protein [Paraflavitalea sp. CAU 1676]MDF2190197.1 hypothetical protein [Paraflavitalea sp. CAU 1676]
MKKLTNLLLAVMALSLSAHAQFKSEPSNAGFIKAVETIMGDFPYNYKHITGELVEATGDWHQYSSTVKIPGSEHCVVGLYHSEIDTTASWQALLFRSDNFSKAKSAYKKLYQQLNQCRLRMVDGSVYFLNGEFEDVSEGMDFVTSAFRIQTADERFREFHVELELLYQLDEWVVNVNMVSKKKDNEVRPDWMTGR